MNLPWVFKILFFIFTKSLFFLSNIPPSTNNLLKNSFCVKMHSSGKVIKNVSNYFFVHSSLHYVFIFTTVRGWIFINSFLLSITTLYCELFSYRAPSLLVVKEKYVFVCFYRKWAAIERNLERIWKKRNENIFIEANVYEFKTFYSPALIIKKKSWNFLFYVIKIIEFKVS